mgnify:CR=1 FL=1
MALVRLAGLASDAAPSQYPMQPSRLANMFLRQQPAARVTTAALEGSGRGTCVMVLGGNGKLSVGFEDPKRDVIVSLSACDLYNCLARRRFDGAGGRGDPQRPKHFSFRHLRARAGRHHDRFQIPGDARIARQQSLRSSCRAQLFWMHEK